MDYSVVLPCAGVGSRMELGYNKLLYPMQNGKTVLENTVSIFLNDKRCKQVVLVIGKNDEETISKLISDPKVETTLGGKTRQESVYNGLLKVTSKYVLIHDGARPFLKKERIDDILKCLRKNTCCILAVPAKDTIKLVDEGHILSTPDRECMYHAQTPQAFHTKLILSCYEKAREIDYVGTDDSSIAEVFTMDPIYVLTGDYDNIKITTKEDLEHPGFQRV